MYEINDELKKENAISMKRKVISYMMQCVLDVCSLIV